MERKQSKDTRFLRVSTHNDCKTFEASCFELSVQKVAALSMYKVDIFSKKDVSSFRVLYCLPIRLSFPMESLCKKTELVVEISIVVRRKITFLCLV